MSAETIPTPLRNAAWNVAEAAKLIISAVYAECLEMPVTFKLGGCDVEVRKAYKPEDGCTVNVRVGV